jgi:hypothetical protein
VLSYRPCGILCGIYFYSLTTLILFKRNTCRSMNFGCFLPIGYLITILVETPILLVVFLQKSHSSKNCYAAFWLTACTYPIVVLVLPAIFFDQSRALYLTVAETFAPSESASCFGLRFESRVFSTLEIGRDVLSPLSLPTLHRSDSERF